MSGAISGWRGGTVSEVRVPAHDAFYMGLALAVTATGPQLYAADFKNNRVEVYNAQWAKVNRRQVQGPDAARGLRAVRHPDDRFADLRHLRPEGRGREP